MFRIGLPLILIALLLLPPGVCVCHLFDGEHTATTEHPALAQLFAGTVDPCESNNQSLEQPMHEIPFEDTEHGHPPGCPTQKATDGQCTVMAHVSFIDAPMVAEFVHDGQATPTAQPQFALDLLPLPGYTTSEVPVYLKVRALLI